MSIRLRWAKNSNFLFLLGFYLQQLSFYMYMYLLVDSHVRKQTFFLAISRQFVFRGITLGGNAVLHLENEPE